MKYDIVCTNCGASYTGRDAEFRCGKCNSILEVKYDYDSLKLAKNFKSRKIEHKKYEQFYPVSSRLTSDGEGGTRLLTLRNAYKGIKKLYLKLETENPTRSFKDRGSSVEITKAKEAGYKSVCCASTGNMAISISHYAKMDGLDCTIFISRGANPRKLALIRKNGAKIVEIKGDFNDAVEAAEKFASMNKTFLCGDYHYRKEGQKSVIFEILEQLKYKAPDFVCVPVGNATLLAAVYKGLSEFRKVGLYTGETSIVAVQAKNCSPLVTAYRLGKRISYVRPRTKADAIAVGFPTFGFEGLGALKATRGVGVEVSDKEMETAKRDLSAKGVKSELGGAAAFAGFKKLYKKGTGLIKDKSVVVIVSGNNET
jgi:threonine synthase